MGVENSLHLPILIMSCHLDAECDSRRATALQVSAATSAWDPWLLPPSCSELALLYLVRTVATGSVC